MNDFCIISEYSVLIILSSIFSPLNKIQAKDTLP